MPKCKRPPGLSILYLKWRIEFIKKKRKGKPREKELMLEFVFGDIANFYENLHKNYNFIYK